MNATHEEHDQIVNAYVEPCDLLCINRAAVAVCVYPIRYHRAWHVPQSKLLIAIRLCCRQRNQDARTAQDGQFDRAQVRNLLDGPKLQSRGIKDSTLVIHERLAMAYRSPSCCVSWIDE